MELAGTGRGQAELSRQRGCSRGQLQQGSCAAPWCHAQPQRQPRPLAPTWGFVCPVTEDCLLPWGRSQQDRLLAEPGRADGDGGQGCPCHRLAGDGWCCCSPSPMTLTETVSAKDTPPACRLLPPQPADLQQLGLQQPSHRAGALRTHGQLLRRGLCPSQPGSVAGV